jgi:hypothetical protein
VLTACIRILVHLDEVKSPSDGLERACREPTSYSNRALTDVRRRRKSLKNAYQVSFGQFDLLHGLVSAHLLVRQRAIVKILAVCIY